MARPELRLVNTERRISDNLVDTHLVEDNIENDPFCPEALRFKQLQRLGYRISLVQQPLQSQLLSCMAKNESERAKIIRLLKAMTQQRAWHGTQMLLTYTYRGNYEGIVGLIQARNRETARANPTPFRGNLSDNTLEKCFLHAYQQFLKDPKRDIYLKSIYTDLRQLHLYRLAIALYERLKNKGITSLEQDEMAVLSLGTSFVDVWDRNPLLHP